MAEAKKHVEIAESDTTHDDYMASLVAQAREQWEHDTEQAMGVQTLSITFAYFDGPYVYLPRRPIQSVTTVNYFDQVDSQQTLGSDIWSLDAPRRMIRRKRNKSWPVLGDRWDAVKVTYVAGYDSSSDIPEIDKHAMRLLVGYYFANREMMASDSSYRMDAYERLVRRKMRSSYP